MKNKTKPIFIFKCKTSTGEVVTHGNSNNRMLINVWYLLNKNVTDGRVYYVEDDNGKAYAACPCPMIISPKQLMSPLKHFEKIQNGRIKSGVEKNEN